MAVIAPGSTVGSIRNKIGSNVYTKGRSGPTVRIRVKPKNPRSSAQTTARAYMTAASRAYSALSATNLAKWAAYAASLTFHQHISGTAYTPSAISVFNRLATLYQFLNSGGTIPSTPPTAPYTGDTITIAAAGSAGTITFTGSAQQSAGSKTIFLIQKLKSTARTASPTGYIYGKIAAVPATPFQVTITGLAAGTYAVGYKFGQTATGLASQPVFLGNVTVS